MNEKKKILITCFDRFGIYRENVSKVVAYKLCKKLSTCEIVVLDNDVPTILQIKGYGKILKEKLHNSSYDYVIAMGLFNDSKCKVERILFKISDMNFFKSKDFFYRYGFRYSNFSPCYMVRNILHTISKKYAFKWEFIHIPQKYIDDEDKLENVTHLVYLNIINDIINEKDNNC